MGASVMVHDMALTETRVLAFDLPVVFDLELAARGVRLPYRWDQSYRARVGIVPRRGVRPGIERDVIWIDIDPCYVFHPLNAFDDGDAVVVDVVRHPSMFAIVTDGPMDGPPRMERWTLDPVAGFSATILDDRPQEFPRIDERRTGFEHRFGWSSGASVADLGSTDPRVEGSVLKYDLLTGTVDSAGLGAGRVGGEFVFVADAPDAGEDEGWLLGYVSDLATATSELVVLDAQSMATQARVRIPRRIPAGFHGNWVADAAL
jgi:carotenoid cleavage dioxygenase